MASSLVFNPGVDIFSKASNSERPLNPFVFKPSAQQATNIASVVNQQVAFKPRANDIHSRSRHNASKADKTQRVRISSSPEKRRISTAINGSRRAKEASLLAFFNLNHLKGRRRRQMVKSLKLKLRSRFQVAPLADELLDKVRETVLKHTPSSIDSSRQVVQQHLESYINETDCSSHSSDDNSSEQASRRPSPNLHQAPNLFRKETLDTVLESHDGKEPETLAKKKKRKLGTEEGNDATALLRRAALDTIETADSKEPETLSKKEKREKKRKLAADEEKQEVILEKEPKLSKKQKREARAKEEAQHKFAEVENVSSKKLPMVEREPVSSATPIKKVRVDEVIVESPAIKLKAPKSGRINIRSKIPRDQMPKCFQSLYDGIPDTFKLAKAWKVLPRSILSGKTTGSGNMSNYCYFNTAMQMLSHIAPLVQYLVYYHSPKQCPIERKEKVCVCCEVRDFLLRSYEDQRDGFYILRRLGTILEKRFRTGGRYHEQQDSNDAMLHILEKAIAQLKTQQDNPKAPTPIEEILSFKNRSTITCKSCHYKSVEETDTLLHIMDIPQGRRELDLMDAYKPSTTETIHGYKCSKCKKEVEITKRMEIATLPPYLLVLATRNVVFSMPSFGRKRGRRHGEVESDPRRVVVPPSQPTSFATSEGRKETYSLSGVAVHQGYSHHGGHWVHLGKLPNGQWACHSDRSVSTMPDFQFPRRGCIGVVFGFSRS